MIPGFFAAGARHAAGDGDPHWGDVVLLTDMRTPNGTTFVDLKGHPLTALGSVQIVDGEAVFSGGNNDFITSPDSDDWTFGDEFCIELFGVRMDTPRSGSQCMISHYNSFTPMSSHRSWFVAIESDGSLRLVLSHNGSGVSQYLSTPMPLTGEFDIRIERWNDAGILRGAFYANGLRLGDPQTMPINLYNTTGLFAIGSNNPNSSVGGREVFHGGMKAVRLTRAARNPGASSYTVPTLPLPTA